MFGRSVDGKMGNMRKVVDWTIYPLSSETPHLVTIQADNRIAQVNLETGTALLSDGKGGHQGHIKLHPSMGAKTVPVPAEMLETLKAHCATTKPGPVALVGKTS